jgi:hypothetical protein
MSRTSIGRTRLGVVLIALLAVTGGTAAATPAENQAPAVQQANAFVSNLDLECFRTDPYQPPFTTVTTHHLNPLLTHLPRETHTLGPRTQLCVPVAKNHWPPPDHVLHFIRWVDLACYQIHGQTVNYPLHLSHLNPQLGHLPRRQVVIHYPTELCVPVIKNNAIPPPEVLELVRWIDLKCYWESPQTSLHIGLNLTQLNPVLAHIPPTDVGVTFNRKLCVPVNKNNQPIPPDVLRIIQWIDIEKFDIVTPAPVSIGLVLRHLNPALAHLPPERAHLQARQQLGLPVAKNGLIPPD